MEGCLEEMDASITKGDDGTTPDYGFHQLIAKASHNPYLIEFMEFLNFQLKELIHKAREHSSLKPGWPQLVQQEHVAIFKAVSAKDAEKARKVTVTHITNAGRRLGIKILNLK